MDFAQLETEILTAVQTAAGDPSLSVSWEEITNAWRPASHVKVDVVGISSTGLDEERRAVNTPDDGQVFPRIYGVRLLTLQFTVETQNQRLTTSAIALAETIRTGLYREDIRDTLAGTAEIGIATVGPLQHASYTDEQTRRRSFASFEVVFNAHTAVGGAAIDYIASVRYSGTYTKEDGSTLEVGDLVTLGSAYTLGFDSGFA